jgi:hypothetical protein
MYWARKCDPDVFAACVERADALCENVTLFVRDEVFRKKLHERLRTGLPESRITFAVYLAYPSEEPVLRHHAALRAHMLSYWLRLGYFPLFDKSRKGHLQAAAVASFDAHACKFSRAVLEYYLDKFCWETCPRLDWGLDSYMLLRCAETLGRESNDQSRCLLAAPHDGPHHFRDDEAVEMAKEIKRIQENGRS